MCDREELKGVAANASSEKCVQIDDDDDDDDDADTTKLSENAAPTPKHEANVEGILSESARVLKDLESTLVKSGCTDVIDATSKLTSGALALKACGHLDVKTQDPDSATENSEDEFWKSVRAAGFCVPARAVKGNAIAGRWARRLASDPELRKRYESVPNREEKQQFRSNWARDSFNEYAKQKKTVH